MYGMTRKSICNTLKGSGKRYKTKAFKPKLNVTVADAVRFRYVYPQGDDNDYVFQDIEEESLI